MSFRGSSPISTRVVYHWKSFRSDFYVPIVKHCFEATYVSGCKNFHTGFSPQKSIRSFVSYSGTSVFSQYSSTINKATSNGLEANIGDIVMTCFDSESSLITAKINNIEKRLTYSIIEDNNNETWYAYIDASSGCSSPNSATLKINLGKKKFNNTIPEGYAPFIYGFYDKINNIRCTRVASPVSFRLYAYMSLILISR